MKAELKKTPDYFIRFETNDDIIEVKPLGWELVITAKDSGQEYGDDFETKKEAMEAFEKEVKKLESEYKEKFQFDLQ